jgi:hypothetical protein
VSAVVQRPSPTVLLRELLTAKRAEGFTFAEAWPWALERVLGGTTGAEAVAWRWALSETRDVWEREFAGEGQPPAGPPGETTESRLAAMAIVAAGRRAMQEVTGDGAFVDARCEHCGEPLTAQRDARYCKAACRKAAQRNRERGDA